MLQHCLPNSGSRGSATLPHRLPLRSIPPPRFACGSSHSRGHGRPRSVRKSSRLRVKMPVHLIAAAKTDANLSAHLHRLPTPPPYLRQMRLSPGRDAGVGLQMMRLLGRDAVVGCRIWLQLGRCGVPANHRAQESLF